MTLNNSIRSFYLLEYNDELREIITEFHGGGKNRKCYKGTFRKMNL